MHRSLLQSLSPLAFAIGAMVQSFAAQGGANEPLVIQQPRHPYTRLLISAAPDPDRLGPDGEKAPPLPARGEIPSLINPPT